MPFTISPPLLLELERCSWDAPYEEDIVSGPYVIDYTSSDKSTDTLKLEFSHTGPLRFCLADEVTSIDAPVYISESGTFQFTVKVVHDILNRQSNNITFRGLIKATEESQGPPVVYGCRDVDAANYDGDPTHIHDQNLCRYDPEEVFGCRDETALNYDDDPTHIHNQNLCVYPPAAPWYELGIAPPTATFQPNSDTEEVNVSFQEIDADSRIQTRMHPVDGFSVKAADVRSGHLVKFDEQASEGSKLVFQMVPGGWEIVGGTNTHPLLLQPATFIVTVNERYKDQGGQPLEVTLRLWAEGAALPVLSPVMNGVFQKERPDECYMDQTGNINIRVNVTMVGPSTATLQERVNAGSWDDVGGTIGAGSSNLTVHNRDPGKTYEYRIRYNDPGVATLWSSIGTVSTSCERF